MNYKEFLIFKEKIINKNPSIINLANNNLYDFFKEESFIDEINPKEYIYRCHIVEDYLKLFNLPDSLKEFIGASNGVRASLSVLFKELSNWEIPQDVYPFYQDEISKHQKEWKEYRTLSSEQLFQDEIKGNTLLVTYPLKPLGREFSQNEWNRLFSFLKQNSNNKIVIDMVYQTIPEINKNIFELYQTNQVIILHSLAKMFLLPNVFGICLLPQNEFGKEIRENFKTLEKNLDKLKITYLALHKYKDRYLQLNERLSEQRNKLKALNIIKVQNQGYLFYSEESPDSFLSKGYLVIPESVFGGKNKGSIISSLF